MNNNDEEKTIDKTRFAEILERFSKAENVVESSSLDLNEDLIVKGKTTTILELKR